ncbi:C-X-C motif chemokine 10-like [Eleutherodactylus coqui]|uniref:C-X-C motif chemokine 10-like n=1 Tax=Eleutherodactylus coqui TaxID=57060 RepID=UPI003461E789
MIRKLLVVVCLLGLQFWVHDVAGLQLEPNQPNRSCKCRKTTMQPVSKKVMKKVEIIPSGYYCPEIEIIITTKNDQTVCVDPKAKWLETLLPQLKQRASKQQKPQHKQE